MLATKTTIRFHCRVCKKETPHYYIGEQEYPHKESDWLYNCILCEGTRVGPRPEEKS